MTITAAGGVSRCRHLLPTSDSGGAQYRRNVHVNALAVELSTSHRNAPNGFAAVAGTGTNTARRAELPTASASPAPVSVS